MKICINKHLGFFVLSIEQDEEQEGSGLDCCLIDDEAHSNLGEVEAKARADALRAVTGWEVVKEYEND